MHSKPKPAVIHNSRLNIKSAVAGAFLSALMILPITVKYVQYKLSAASDKQQIVVVDFAQTVAELSLGDESSLLIGQAVEVMDSLLSELANAGFVVLDKQAVLNAPSSMYLGSDAAKRFMASQGE